METLVATFPAVLFLINDVLTSLKHLNEKTNSSMKAKESVEELRNCFLTFQASIKEEENRRRSSSSTSSTTYLSQDFVKNIRDLAFEIEDALDEFMYCVPHHYHTSKIGQGLHNTHAAYSRTYRKAAKTLSTQRSNIVKKMESLTTHKLHKERLKREIPGSSSDPECLKTDHMLADDEIVGYKKLRKDLVHQLIEGEDANCENQFIKRVTIQVVGPGGSGKTFLVKNVYRKRKVEEHFDCRAWIRVTQSFNLEELLWDMLKQFCSKGNEPILRELAGNIEQKLDCYLQHKKYLIVLDDVWDKTRFTAVVNSLPRDSAGSRIIITTRRSDVVDKANYSHKIEGLTKEEAQELFCRHAFHGPTSKEKICPQDLKDLADKIIEKCDRYPLHVATVGNLLSTKPKRKDKWEFFYNSLGSEIRDSTLPIVNLVLQPSLMDLPDHLQNCFLYFAVFPEGYSIRRGRLIRSWLAEGFVEERSGKTLEEVAEAYLNDLIGRNLVQVSESEIDGRVRSCKIPRLYHDYIIWLSRKANFITVMSEINGSNIISEEKVRRLSIHDVGPQLSHINESIKKCVRTFFMFGQPNFSRSEGFLNDMRKALKGTDPTNSIDLENVLHNFRFLKVLDLEGVPGLENYEHHIGCFLLLRDLNLRKTNIKKLPSSIEKLTLLETIDLRNTQVTELPKWIYRLMKLRHLLVSCFDSLNDVSSTSPSSDAKLGVKVFHGNIGALSSLQKLSLIKVINKKTFIEHLGSLTQLTKLGLADLKTEFGWRLCKSIEKMKNLSTFEVRASGDDYLDLDHLQNPPNHVRSLYLNGRLIRQTLPGWISPRSLPSLVKVVLKGSKLGDNQDPFKGLETLPSLMELKMVDYYSGKRLVFKAETFKSLKKLHIEQFDELTEMTVEDEAMTSLKKLTIYKCKMLEPFPLSYSLGKLEELDLDEFINDDFISDIKRRREEGELARIPAPVPIPGHPFFKY